MTLLLTSRGQDAVVYELQREIGGACRILDGGSFPSGVQGKAPVQV